MGDLVFSSFKAQGFRRALRKPTNYKELGLDLGLKKTYYKAVKNLQTQIVVLNVNSFVSEDMG